jgi:hypothetical protein
MDCRILTIGLLICLSALLGGHGVAKLITAYRTIDFATWRKLAFLAVVSLLSSATLADVALATLAPLTTGGSSSLPSASP